MSAKIIGEDAAISLKLGTVSAGTITWDGGGLTSIVGNAKRITERDSVDTVNTKALGDSRKKYRAHSGGSEVTVEQMVPFAGFQYLTSRATRIGDAAQISIKEYSGLSSGMVFTGLVTEWSTEIVQGEATLEKLTIMCDIDAS